MKRISSNFPNVVRAVLAMVALWIAPLVTPAEPPQIGDKAPDFTLKTLNDQSVTLSALTAKGEVALIVLRGWPGYQCPLCERQVHDLVVNASKLRDRHIQMLFVYPGPAPQLKVHATEFLQNKDWPKEFQFATDPEFTFTKSYGLRWDAPMETAYPSTFIIGKDKKVRFARISKEHGGRVLADELLKQFDALK